MGIVLIPAILLWIWIAIKPYRAFRKSGDRARAMKIGLPFAVIVLGAPFWDFPFMIPAIYSAYYQHETHAVYSTSNAKSVLLMPPEAGIPYSGYYVSWDGGLYEGKLLFVEKYGHTKSEWNNPKVEKHLIRYTREPMASEACNTRSVFSKHNGLWCISEQPVEKSNAEVIVEAGRYLIAPYSWMPKKTYQYDVWRVRDAKTGELIVDGAWGFIWDPSACYFANACRYVIDRGTYSNYSSMAHEATPNIY